LWWLAVTRKPQKIWRERPCDEAVARSLAMQAGVTPLMGVLLAQRGIDTPEAVRSFLRPSFEQLPSPLLMKDMEQAVAVVVRAVREQLPVVVYGDYDVDGTTGIAVLVLFLREIGLECHGLQPRRFEHGYGLHADLLPEPAGGAGLLITVDCGISDAVEVARARERGWTVIVTDHHQPPAALPEADAVLNPLQPGCDFPFKYLAGVGVAFYLVMGVRAALREAGFWPAGKEEPNLKNLLDLVAVGSICDMVPMVGANRVLSVAGLSVLSDRQRPGLRQLLRLAGVNGRQVAADDVGYRIGPRLNAPGRLASAALALELLLTNDDTRAAELAVSVDGMNRERQQLVEEQFRQSAVAAAEIGEARKTLVLHGKDWHGGVLGIVASRLVDDFCRPTILLRSEGGLLKGSGRSVDGFDLHGALLRCEDLLEAYGGHTSAAGLTLRPENLAAFKERFEEVAVRELTEEMQRPVLWVDYRLSGEELGDESFLRDQQLLAPFGIGNPEPVFAPPEDIRLEQAKVVGGNHLRFSWRASGVTWSGIGFGLGHCLDKIRARPARLAFTVRRNCFRGREQWQLNAVDIDVNTTT